MALREELLKIKGVGPKLADDIDEAVTRVLAQSEELRDAPNQIVESVPGAEGKPFSRAHVAGLVAVPPGLLDAIRERKTRGRCALCGVDGCDERCPAWTI